MKTYTEEQIAGVFDRKTSGIHAFLEAGTTTPPPKEGLPQTPEEMDATPTDSKTPNYKSIKVGDDKVDIDLENDLVYINDELVTPDVDTPKHIIDVLRKVVPQVLKSEEEGKK